MEGLEVITYFFWKHHVIKLWPKIIAASKDLCLQRLVELSQVFVLGLGALLLLRSIFNSLVLSRASAHVWHWLRSHFYLSSCLDLFVRILKQWNSNFTKRQKEQWKLKMKNWTISILHFLCRACFLQSHVEFFVCIVIKFYMLIYLFSYLKLIICFFSFLSIDSLSGN